MLPLNGPRSHVREPETAIDPNREDLATLSRLKRDMGSLHFSAQYQQEPIAREGNMVKQDWFKSFDPKNIPNRFDAMVISWDTASATGAQNDYSVGTVWGILGSKYYLLRVYLFKLEYVGLKRQVHEITKKFNANLVLLEGADSGRNLYSDMRYQGVVNYQIITPVHSKEDRFAACSAIIEEGRVLLPTDAAWLSVFLNELIGFPRSRHDDQVDSFSMFINFMRKRRDGLLEYDDRGRQKTTRRPGSRRIRQ